MAEVNINRSHDPFYRYKMPKIITKVEGNGNGIKTVIPNLSDIAKAKLMKSGKSACFYTHYAMMIDWNGDALLCCQDMYNRTVKFGNVQTKPLIDIWTDGKIMKFRIFRHFRKIRKIRQFRNL